MSYGINMIDVTIDLEVSFCKKCNFVFQNSAYSKVYDTQITKLYASYKISNMYKFPNKNAQHSKALDFISNSVSNDINYNVLEIGSNRGDFLYILKEKFPNINILGCEPTEFKDLQVPTINSFFNKNLFNTKFDLVILRHTLEHIKYPKEFIKTLSSILKENGSIFIEVPNIQYSLTNYIEDFTPDHVNYFSKESLANTFLNYKMFKSDDEGYLYALFRKNSKKTELQKNNDNIELLFSEFNHKIKICTDEVKQYKRIIFYGISNFYLWTYIKLKKSLTNKELFFMDDFVKEDKIFNLKRIGKPALGDLVILCSSNDKIQNKMMANLEKNISVMRPYKGIESV
jgi:SAM-dependent methyltransferase